MANPPKAYALIDGNSFFCSCEMVFRPELKGGPVIVASSNDGCAIALTPAAKALGFKMGAPLFKIRNELERLGVTVFSSNYTLYGDMSDRMMATIETMAPDVAPYSIDEAFCDLTGMPEPLLDYGRAIQTRVHRWTGIPVGIGIAPTKTLAKLANHASKKWMKQTGGVVDLRDPARQEKLLRLVQVDDIWGVGSGLKAKLNRIGIQSGWDLATHDISTLRKIGGVVLERTARELTGVCCLPLDEAVSPKQMICKGQAFGEKVREIGPLRQAVASYITVVAEKLRAQQSVCTMLRVSIRTSMFSTTEPQYSQSLVVHLAYPTDDTRALISAGQHALTTLFEPGYAYAKAEVLLMGLSQRHEVTADLFAPAPRPNSDALMSTLDTINKRMGRGTIRPGSVPLDPSWKMARRMKSPNYTTDLKELWVVQAK